MTLTPAKLNIALLTYNHAEFIERALNSVLNQKTNFPFLIIVGDDGSTDGTQDILKSYLKKYPDQIKLLLSPKNFGVFHNIHKLLKACTAPYIAILEGDDYWSYPNKLQAQVDFLVHHPNYQGCFHDTLIEVENNELNLKTNQYFSGFRYYSQFNQYNTDFHPWDLITRTIIPTSALVFVNNNWSEQILKFKDISLSLSWAFELLLLKKDTYNPGKFRYINEVWSTYTNHSNGITKQKDTSSFIKTNKKILKRLLKDPYYRNLKDYIYFALMEEERYTYFQTSIKRKPWLTILQFIRYSLLYTFYRALSFIKLTLFKKGTLRRPNP